MAIFCFGPSLLVMLAARYFAARALGMKGIDFFFGGAVEDAVAATPVKRAGVVLAALVASYLVAGVCFAAAAVAGGKTVLSTEITVIPDRPAAAAGMASGDRVVSVGGQPVATWEHLAAAIAAHGGEPTEIVARRRDDEVRFTLTPAGRRGSGKIGIAAVPGSAKHEPADAGLVLGALVVAPMRVVVDTGRGLVSVVSGSNAGELAGPVAIVGEASKANERGEGAAFFLGLLAVMLATVWPLTAVIAIVTVPRKRRG